MYLSVEICIIIAYIQPEKWMYLSSQLKNKKRRGTLSGFRVFYMVVFCQYKEITVPLTTARSSNFQLFNRVDCLPATTKNIIHGLHAVVKLNRKFYHGLKRTCAAIMQLHFVRFCGMLTAVTGWRWGQLRKKGSP